MKTSKYLLITAILLVNVSGIFGQTSYSFDDGLKAAKSGGKKIFIDIYSNSDSWCKKMDAEVYPSSKVQSALGNFVFIKLDAGSQNKFTYDGKEYSSANLAKFFGGTGYPTFVVLNPDGSIIKFRYNNEEVSNLSGFIGESDFIEMLNYFSQGNYKNTDISTIFQN